MHLYKKIICTILSLCILTGCTLSDAATANAGEDETIPASAPDALSFYYDDVCNGADYAIDVSLGTYGYRVANVQTNSSNLVAKLTKNTKSTNAAYAYLGLYAKEAGSYLVTCDICNVNGNVIQELKIKVHILASTDTSPFQKLTFAGAEDFASNVTELESGKLSVTLNENYVLDEISVITYDETGMSTRSTVSNNTDIALGKYAKRTESKSSYGSKDSDSYYSSHSVNTSMMAETKLAITVTDPTGAKNTYSYSIYRIAEPVTK